MAAIDWSVFLSMWGTFLKTIRYFSMRKTSMKDANAMLVIN